MVWGSFFVQGLGWFWRVSDSGVGGALGFGCLGFGGVQV